MSKTEEGASPSKQARAWLREVMREARACQTSAHKTQLCAKVVGYIVQLSSCKKKETVEGAVVEMCRALVCQARRAKLPVECLWNMFMCLSMAEFGEAARVVLGYADTESVFPAQNEGQIKAFLQTLQPMTNIWAVRFPEEDKSHRANTMRGLKRNVDRLLEIAERLPTGALGYDVDVDVDVDDDDDDDDDE